MCVQLCMNTIINNTQFTAIKLNSTTVQRRVVGNKFKDVNVNYVRILPEDKPAITKFSQECNTHQLTKNILEDIDDRFSEIFALTSQHKNLKKLNPKKILGLVETIDVIDTKNLTYLVSGRCDAYTKNKYAGIGKAIVKNVVQDAKNKDMIEVETYSLRDAKAFYEKMLFKSGKKQNYFKLGREDFDKMLNL